MQKLSCSIFISFCFLLSLAAQSNKGISIETSFHYGKILRHTPKLTIQIPTSSFGIDGSIKFQTYGKADWQHWQNYPQWGINFLYYKLGNDQLGSAYGILPSLQLAIFKKKWLQFDLSFASGLAYLSEPYDALNNPENNAIGSSINNVTTFKTSFRGRLSENWSWLAGGSFTHFSNGASKLPNLGINIVAFNAGLNYKLNPVTKEDYRQASISKKPINRFGFSLHFGLALREMISYGGPKYPIYIGSAAGVYHFNKVNRLLVGVEYEFNQAVYRFGLHTFDFDSATAAQRGATRWMIFVADEFMIGRIGILLQAGIYVSKSSFLTPFPIYNKIGIRYYFPAIGKPKTNLYVGTYLKSHKIDAAYIAFGMGAMF